MTPKATPDGEITVHSLVYSKADLDKAPADERLFYLMAGSVANDTAILNKALLASLGTQDFGNRIANQGNSTSLGFILRMLSGRLVEAFKLTSDASKMIKKKYQADLSPEAHAAFYAVLKYFAGKRSLLLNVRDGMAFHHLREHVDQAYQSLDASLDLGEYMHTAVGNTLYYTAEILHYETLKNISGLSHEDAIGRWVDDAIDQSKNFGTFLGGFALVFAKRYLPRSLDNAYDEAETVPVVNAHRQALPFFTRLPDGGGVLTGATSERPIGTNGAIGTDEDQPSSV